MLARRLVANVIVAGVMLVGGIATAHPPRCHLPPLTGGYGNAGFSAGYSTWIGGFGCRPLPYWGPCGWYGSSRYAFRDSVFLSVPVNGSATFFSGSVNSFVLPYAWYPSGVGCGCGPMYGPVYGGMYGGMLFTPYGTWLPAGYAPTFGPAGVFPFLNAFGANVAPAPAWRRSVAASPRPQLAVTDRQPAVRASNAEARRRALKLVAVGDKHMRAAVAAPGKLTSALDAYRRAAAIAPDLPDTFVRQAIALVALERDDAAARALDRVAAIDSRLESATADRGLIAIREIWKEGDAAAPAPGPQPNWIADRWTALSHPGLTALAVAPAANRDPAVK